MGCHYIEVDLVTLVSYGYDRIKKLVSTWAYSELTIFMCGCIGMKLGYTVTSLKFQTFHYMVYFCYWIY